MNDVLIYPVGCTAALKFAEQMLKSYGFPLVDHPTPEVSHLLMDVPSFGVDGRLHDGTDPERVLERLPATITIAGGNLGSSTLADYKTIDFLKDPIYLAENAMITAECALQAASPLLKTTFRETPVLIIGWGRIGKCLGQLLRGFGAEITISARKEADRAMISALGYQTADTAELCKSLSKFRLIFNTVPDPVLSAQQLALCKNCEKIDLASRQGLAGEDVLWARGLPGVYAPESSGKLIAKTFIRLYMEGSA